MINNYIQTKAFNNAKFIASIVESEFKKLIDQGILIEDLQIQLKENKKLIFYKNRLLKEIKFESKIMDSKGTFELVTSCYVKDYPLLEEEIE